MLLPEAVRLQKTARRSTLKKVLLVCSFEPLHLQTYLQAFLALRFPDDTPDVITFGYDRLTHALQAAPMYPHAPTLLFISWEDIHPALSWRTRADFASVDAGEITREGEKLASQLVGCIQERSQAETYLVLPPLEWLPLHDAGTPETLGATAVAASEVLWKIARQLSGFGPRILYPRCNSLNYRDLLLAGHPLSLEQSENLAKQFVEVAFRVRERKKVLVTDLDETLWAGVVGEDGREAIALGPQGRGYPFHVYQKFLKKLKTEGVLLAFCSKNNPEDILPAFDELGMPVKCLDFVTYRCNWQSKAENVASIARELNLDLSAFVFIDNNEAELAEMKHKLPSVSVLRTPSTANQWIAFFAELQDLFHTWQVNPEDQARTSAYQNERQRKTALSSVDCAKQDDWSHLADLGITVEINPNAWTDPRSLDLINKTNQFNLTGQRLSKEEWLEYAAARGSFCLSARARDRFGDFGTISIVIGSHAAQKTFVRQMVLSCRAFGRGIEMVLLGEIARQSQGPFVTGAFKETGKNVPARDFLQRIQARFVSDREWETECAAVAKAARAVIDEARITVTTRA